VRRRDFIKVIAGSAAAWPLAAGAQQPPVPVVGFLSANTSTAVLPKFAPAFVHGLSEGGFVNDQNVAIEYRWANGQYNRLSALAAELVHRPVNVIVAVGGTASALAAKAATTTIPIVFNLGSDPVKLGLVGSLNRPGGNITGVSYLAASLVPKLFETLHEVVPGANVIAVLANPKFADTKTILETAQTAARAIGQQPVVVNASTDGEINTAFKSIAEQRVNALVVLPDPFFTSRRQQIVALATSQGRPAIYPWPEFTKLGGLMSYGTSLPDAYRQVGIYTAKILRGAKPAELPVQEAVKIELILNLKTAKSLGVTFPVTLLGRADEVIE
jgi:putative ABC transport system substrate-binding protein